MAAADVRIAVSPTLIAPKQEAEMGDPFVRVYDLPCTLVLEMPVVDFHVGTLLQLRPGSIVVTDSQQNEDLLLSANGQLVGMVEVDVVGNRLAVRLTGMA